MKNTNVFNQLNDEEYLCFKHIIKIVSEKDTFSIEDLRFGIQEDDEIRKVIEEINNPYLNSLLQEVAQDDEPGVNYVALRISNEEKVKLINDLNNKLSDYKDKFYKNELEGNFSNFLRFESQREYLEERYFIPNTKKYGDKFSLTIRLNNRYRIIDHSDVLIYQTLEVLESKGYLNMEKKDLENTKDKRFHGLNYEVKLNLDVTLDSKYSSDILPKGKQNDILFVIRCYEENGQSYCNIGDKIISLKANKKVYKFLDSFKDNLSRVDRKTLSNKFSGESNLGNVYTRTKKILEENGFTITSTKNGKKTSYKITKNNI